MSLPSPIASSPHARLVPKGATVMGKRTLRKGRRGGSGTHRLSNSSLPMRSRLARDRALNALAAMRKDPNLSFTHAAKMYGVKEETIKKHFSSALKKEKGRFKVAKSDRYRSTLYVPSADGQPVPVQTRGSRERRQLSNYLRDVGRYMGED